MRTYPEGTAFNGRIGRTWDVSEAAFPVNPSPPQGAPNVICVVIDGVGFGWCDTFGGLVEMPNLNRLANHGLRYVNFHTTGLGSPTRSCLLTGRNHHSNGMAGPREMATGFPGYNGRQPPERAAIGAMMRLHGYATFYVGKWQNTPPEETGPLGPYDRWPTGPIFGFDRFYGFLAGDTNQWFPKLHLDRTPIDPPAIPEEGYHLSADLVDRSVELIASHQSVARDKPWLLHLAFGACHAPHHAPRQWIEAYRGRFDMGWDRYREVVLARQQAMGVMPATAVLPPMLDGVQAWTDLSSERRRLFARMAEVYAGCLSHTDHQIGRLVQFLDAVRVLENTLLLVLVGDSGCSAEGTLDGLFNEASLGAHVPESLEFKLARIDQLGQPGSYNHYPVGWALAGNTPFKLCQQYVHLGGVRNPLVLHWPRGITARGELRHQFQHVIDVVPTILEAVGVDAPPLVNGVSQAPIEGVPMNYTFADANAPTNHPTQYFEMLGNRGIVHQGWKAVTFNGRLPWSTRSWYETVDDQHWELYHLDEDPVEAHDLMMGRVVTDLECPLVKKLVELIGLWWAEAGRYQVLPLDDRVSRRSLSPGDVCAAREQRTFFKGAVRIPESLAPDTRNRSWIMTAHVVIPAGGAEGPICALGGDTNGWALYVKDGKATFCYNLAGSEITYIRSELPLRPGRHVIRYGFEKTERRAFGAGGVGRLWVDGRLAAEGRILRTTAFAYCLDETFDVGCDKGSPVTDDYGPLASFTGTLLQVDFDLEPDGQPDPDQHDDMHGALAMVRQ